jgi:FkbM family methyltransferase
MKKIIIKLYIYIFSKPFFSKLNLFLLNISLKAYGYDNYDNNDEGGENFFIASILSKSNSHVCIDIGAGSGNYTSKLLKLTNAKVISFEPLPSQFKILKENVRNFSARSTVINKAVGDKNGKCMLHFNSIYPNKGSISEDIKKVPYVTNDDKLEVPLITLDKFMEDKNFESLDLIKIDTEGFESEVIKGAFKTIEKYKPKYIQTEFNWHHLFCKTSINDFFELLPPKYELYQLIPNGWVKRDPRDPISNIYRYSNFVFVRRDKI